MELLKPAGGGAREREMAVLESRAGFLCFWELTEPEILSQFEGVDTAYFEADVDGSSVKIGRRVSEEDW
jgi:hypothetical protein